MYNNIICCVYTSVSVCMSFVLRSNAPYTHAHAHTRIAAITALPVLRSSTHTNTRRAVVVTPLGVYLHYVRIVNVYVSVKYIYIYTCICIGREFRILIFFFSPKQPKLDVRYIIRYVFFFF